MAEVYDPHHPDPPRQEKPSAIEGEVVDIGGGGGQAIDLRGMLGGFGSHGAKPRFRASGCIGGVSLILLCLCVFLPGFFSIPPVDRDEARFAQASRQMYESVALAPALRTSFHDGGLIIPKVQDRPRLNKPPLIYWLQSASAAVFSGGNPYRDAIWMYRLPSLIAAIITVLAVYRLGTRMFDRRTGWLAAALLAVSPVIAWEAHQARADMVLLACTTVAMAALWDCFSGWLARSASEIRRGAAGYPLRPALTLWLALALGILTKGPITPLVVILTALTLSILSRNYRWLRHTKPLLGLPLAILIVAPWVWAVAQRVGWDTYLATITGETVGRSFNIREGHWGPPGYHLVLLPVLFWPGSLLTAAGVVLAWKAARGPAPTGRIRWDVTGGSAAPPSGYAFCLAWILPSWILFELISTKLPHYVMPLYPAVALLSARAVLAAQAGALPLSRRRDRFGAYLWLAIGAVLAAAAVTFTAITIPDRSAIGAFFLAIVTIAAACVLLWNLRAAYSSIRVGKYLRVQLAGVLIAVISLFLILRYTLPPALGLSRNIVAAIAAIDPAHARPLAAVGYHEDSLIYLTRGRVERINEPDLGTWLAANPTGIVLRQDSPPPDPQLPRSLRALDTIAGFNIAKGRFVRITIAERDPPPSTPPGGSR